MSKNDTSIFCNLISRIDIKIIRSNLIPIFLIRLINNQFDRIMEIDLAQLHQQLLDSESCDECGSQWQMSGDEAWNCSNTDCDSQFFLWVCQLCGKESCSETFLYSIQVKDSNDESNEEGSEDLRYCSEHSTVYMMCENCPHYLTFISFVSGIPNAGKVYPANDKKCVYVPEEETKAGIWIWKCDHCDQTTTYETKYL